MALVFSRHTLLHELSLAAVQTSLHRHALELAILGSVRQAQTLMSCLFHSGQVVHVSTAMRHGLCQAWLATGLIPEGIDWRPARGGRKGLSREDLVGEFVDVERRAYEGYHWGRVAPRDRVFDERGLEAVLKANGELDGKGRGTGVDGVEGFEDRYRSWYLTRALDISLRLSQGWLRVDKDASNAGEPVITSEELDGRSEDLLRQIVQRWNADGQLAELGITEKLWPYYLKGMVADVFGMSRQQVEATGRELIDIYIERLVIPLPELELSTASTRDLLERAELNTLCGAGNRYWINYGLHYRCENYFRPRASEEQIAALEKRLNTTLPDDYKDFLRTTNGFGEKSDGIFHGFCPGPELWSVEKVVWREEEFQRGRPVELLNELPFDIRDLVPSDTQVVPPEYKVKWEYPLPCFNRVIEIGRRDVQDMWLVPPVLVKYTVEVYNLMYERGNQTQKDRLLAQMEKLAGSKREFDSWADGTHWCVVICWSGSGPAIEGYASFKDYLEKAVRMSGKTDL